MSKPGQYDLQLDRNSWIVVRLDGRNFSGRSQQYKRPFDPQFHAAMRQVTETLMAETPAVAAHTASDEISLIFAPDTDWFSHRFDKWISTCASVAGAALFRYLTRIEGIPSADARALAISDQAALTDYLHDRLRNSRRNCRNAYIYWSLREQGLSPREADTRSRQMAHERNDFIPTEAADWESYGAIVYYSIVSHTGLDPRTNTPVPTTRRRLSWAELDGPAGLEQVTNEITSYAQSLGNKG